MGIASQNSALCLSVDAAPGLISIIMIVMMIKVALEENTENDFFFSFLFAVVT